MVEKFKQNLNRTEETPQTQIKVKKQIDEIIQ